MGDDLGPLVQDLHRRFGGDVRFVRAAVEIIALHGRKSQDYGRETDPFHNIRSSEAWGIPAWLGALVREHDKTVRLQQFARRGSLANESVEDSMLDKAVYSLIALVLYREASERARTP